jgi:hypothetical protein
MVFDSAKTAAAAAESADPHRQERMSRPRAQCKRSCVVHSCLHQEEAEHKMTRHVRSHGAVGTYTMVDCGTFKNVTHHDRSQFLKLKQLKVRSRVLRRATCFIGSSLTRSCSYSQAKESSTSIQGNDKMPCRAFALKLGRKGPRRSSALTVEAQPIHARRGAPFVRRFRSGSQRCRLQRATHR